MQQPATDQQPELQPSVTDKHTEAIHPRRSTISNLGKIFPTCAQEYDSVTTVTGEIMAMNMIISIITEIYSKAAVSDLDTMYFHQAMK